LVFQLDRWRYAIASSRAIEVAPAVTIMPLPKGPRIVEGLINLHGSLVPVVDIRSRFGLPTKAPELTDHLLVATARERIVALHVDRVIGLMPIADGVIEDARHSVSTAEYVAGVAKLPDGLILIHDLATFLSQAEAEELELLELGETTA
jgi:purine-binding chemotaxis protein CheW